MEPEGVTCATRVTRGTIDFQARDNFELRDEEFARKFQVAFKCEALKAAFKQKLVAHTREALKVGFKQKLVPRVTRVAHVPPSGYLLVALRAPTSLLESYFECSALYNQP